jgi:hypothetical protein
MPAPLSSVRAQSDDLPCRDAQLPRGERARRDHETQRLSDASCLAWRFPSNNGPPSTDRTSCPPETSACDISMEPGGKGSFQAAKLQRSARTTVCSHSTRDLAAMRSIESEHDYSDTQNEFLSGYGHV